MSNYGLIGFPLTNSFSESYFKKRFETLGKDHFYKNFPLRELSGLKNLVQLHQLSGFNVTIPHKQAVIELLDVIDPEAELVSAINTVRVDHDKLTGYNTDIIGFEQSLKPLLTAFHKRALVLGSGGASRAVIHVLRKLEIPHALVSRSSRYDYRYGDLNQAIVQAHGLIINCTPLGSALLSSPPSIPYKGLTEEHLCYDLIYTPELTPFLKKSRKQGAQVKNGLEMLHLQAEESLRIWLK